MTDRGRALANELVDVASGHISAILLFGSQLVGTKPSPDSAYDFVVVVDGYLPFYRSLHDAGHHDRSPRVLAALSGVLAPNIVAFLPDLPDRPVAKCMILTGPDFERALGPKARDHFLKGRMAQSVEVVHSRDRKIRAWIERLLGDARRDVLSWAGPHLDDSFDAEGLARRMLNVSYRGEIRPEAKDRVNEVFQAQREELTHLYGIALEEACAAGSVVRQEDGRFALTTRPSAAQRWGVALYFFRSKARATARWLKHVVTFNDWLTYIQRKVERRTGERVEITPRERKYPLIFLWPKVFRVVRSLPRQHPKPPEGSHGGANPHPGELDDVKEEPA